MDRVLTCSCGEKIVVSPSQAGRAINCPSCNTALNVPTLRGLSELPAAERTSASVAKTSSDTWKFRGPIVAVSFAGILLCGLYAFFQFQEARNSRYLQVTDDDSTVMVDSAIHTKAEADNLDHVQPDELLSVWDSYSKSSLGPKRPPDYKIYNDYSRSCFRAATIASSICAVFVVTAVSTVLSARKKKA